METKKMEPIHIEQMEERQEAASCKQSISGKAGRNQTGNYYEVSYTISF